MGVPARIAGVPQWAQKEGNHTWTEYWDGDWHFLGADEYDKNGPDRAWFNADAALTVAMGTNSINQYLRVELAAHRHLLSARVGF